MFDIKFLETVGWYSQGGKSRRPKNIEGMSRDHRVSKTDAIVNNYDPFYITHPINCELMSQRNNSKKHAKSSISYGDLVIMVNNYENKMGSLLR